MILIASVGYRTGSTLMQRLLNTSNECMIYGEDNTILQLIDNYLSQRLSPIKRANKQAELFVKNKNIFSANLSRPFIEYKSQMSNLLNSLYGSSDFPHTGFKCISPTFNHVKTFIGLADSPKIILTYRNINDSYESYKSIYNWMDKGAYFGTCGRTLPVLKYVLKHKPQSIFPVKYSDINEDKINEMFDWLGINNRENIKETLSLKIREMDNFNNNDKNYEYLEQS